MSRLIDADELLVKLDAYCESCYSYQGIKCRVCSCSDSLAIVDEMPTVEPNKGKWIRMSDSCKCSTRFVCSECHEISYYNHGVNSRRINAGSIPLCKYNFCPWCGADMRGE